MKETIKFYRRGFLISNKPTDTQCTIEGWKGYRYVVTVEAYPRLDKNGFLIDHNSIHKLVTKYVRRNPMLSCEMTLRNICGEVIKLLQDYGCVLQKVGMEIRPVDHRLLTKNKQTKALELIDPNVKLIDMPAHAEYWAVF